MNPLLPGATIGILGGGQLGRMFGLAARHLGYRVHTYEPTPDSPAGQVADREVNRPYEDLVSLHDFASRVDVVTYEFENVPMVALEALEGKVPLRPNREVLYVAQNRRREKEFLAQHGFPITGFRVVTSESELRAGVAALGCPCVLKTADFGYDGKGQQKVSATSDLTAVWQQHGTSTGVLEAWVDYTLELSCLVARNRAGEMRVFPVVENRHTHHILDLSLIPANVSPAIELAAKEIAQNLARQFDLVGLLAVEFFLTKSGDLLINELAPRPHNSGHFTIDACVTSQFEQQLRAVCDLPLGDTQLLCPAIMRNLLGDCWSKGEPAWDQLLAIPGLKLHLYGKTEARPGRKMGHYTILGQSLNDCLTLDRWAQDCLLGA